MVIDDIARSRPLPSQSGSPPWKPGVVLGPGYPRRLFLADNLH